MKTSIHGTLNIGKFGDVPERGLPINGIETKRALTKKLTKAFHHFITFKNKDCLLISTFKKNFENLIKVFQCIRDIEKSNLINKCC